MRINAYVPDDLWTEYQRIRVLAEGTIDLPSTSKLVQAGLEEAIYHIEEALKKEDDAFPDGIGDLLRASREQRAQDWADRNQEK